MQTCFYATNENFGMKSDQCFNIRFLLRLKTMIGEYLRTIHKTSDNSLEIVIFPKSKIERLSLSKLKVEGNAYRFI